MPRRRSSESSARLRAKQLGRNTAYFDARRTAVAQRAAIWSSPAAASAAVLGDAWGRTRLPAGAQRRCQAARISANLALSTSLRSLRLSRLPPGEAPPQRLKPRRGQDRCHWRPGKVPDPAAYPVYLQWLRALHAKGEWEGEKRGRFCDDRITPALRYCNTLRPPLPSVPGGDRRGVIQHRLGCQPR